MTETKLGFDQNDISRIHQDLCAGGLIRLSDKARLVGTNVDHPDIPLAPLALNEPNNRVGYFPDIADGPFREDVVRTPVDYLMTSPPCALFHIRQANAAAKKEQGNG